MLELVICFRVDSRMKVVGRKGKEVMLVLLRGALVSEGERIFQPSKSSVQIRAKVGGRNWETMSRIVEAN
jgi:urease accessory protein UreE